MTEREKVIKGLKCCTATLNSSDACPTECPYFGKCMEGINRIFFDMMNDAIALLKAQEPIEPVVCGDGASFEKARTWWYACGACNKAIDMTDQYCRHCGRAVKWDD